MNKPHLKKLAFPADMFNVTPSFLADIGTHLKSLQEVELGFDYQTAEYMDAFAALTWALPKLKKATLLSLNRPVRMTQFDTINFIQAISGEDFTAAMNPTLKHLRFRLMSHESYKGKYDETRVFYRRDDPLPTVENLRWWKPMATHFLDSADTAFEDSLVPTLAELAEGDSTSDSNYKQPEPDEEVGNEAGGWESKNVTSAITA